MVKVPVGISIDAGHVGLWCLSAEGIAPLWAGDKVTDALLVLSPHVDEIRLMTYDRLCAVYEGIAISRDIDEYEAIMSLATEADNGEDGDADA